MSTKKYIDNNILNNDFGFRITFIRNKLKINQPSFAKMLGVTTGAISHWEKGLRQPDVSMIKKIAELGDVDLIWLLTGKEAKTEKDYFNIPFRKSIEQNDKKTIKKILNKLGIQTFRIVSNLSAGKPIEFFDDGQLDDEKNVMLPYPHKNCLAMWVKGDSMLPSIDDGDLVVVDLNLPIKDEDVVAVRLNDNQQFIKRYKGNDGQKTIIFYSDNAVYPPVLIDKDRIEQIYKVVKIIKDI